MGRNDNKFRSNGGADNTVNGVTLRYDGIGIGSNKSFSVSSVSNKESFSKVDEILNRESAYQNYGNPCDLYSVSLDGSVSALPENTENVAVGLWSKSQTDENGRFSPQISISAQADEYFSTAGITLKFDTNKGIYANDLLIEWYRDGNKLSEKKFAPDNAEYFCANRVELFNRVDVTFYGLNAPKNRLRLQGMEFGIVTDFTSRTLKNSAVKQSVSPISESLPISTLNFSIVSRDGIDFVFQERQPIEAYFNDKLKGLFFIKKATQSGENAYSVACEDYVGLLEEATFNGDVYRWYGAGTLIRKICAKAGVPVVVPPEVETKYVSGYLPRGTCRKALQQVLFALQLHADTSDFNGLRIKALTKNGQTIPRNRIMQGISVKEDSKVTAVEIVAHSYVPLDEEIILYDAKESGTGKEIEVIFSEPYHSLALENGHIIEWSANHAIFDATENTRLRGKKYLHTTVAKRKQNTLLTATDKSNVLRIENATLVNANNVDKTLNNCYNYLIKNQTISAKIVEGKHESDTGYIYDTPVALGENLTLETAFKGNVTGTLESQSYSMNGGILVKECILK